MGFIDPRFGVELTGNQSGCAACGRAFTSVGAFDAHRNRGKGRERGCQDPAEVGLVLRDNGMWGFEPPAEMPAHWKKGDSDAHAEGSPAA